MYNGDTAMVAVQYSYLPSWVSFLADQQKSMESGRLMIDTIHERWQQLPADHRPKLVLYGESLGSMAGQAAFGYCPMCRIWVSGASCGRAAGLQPLPLTAVRDELGTWQAGPA